MLLFDYQDRRPYGRIGYCQTREIATGLGLAVGALAGMFYDAVPKFSYAFIARMTIHYHYETIFPNTPNNKMPDSARAEQQLRIRARGA